MSCYTADQVMAILDGSDTESEIEEDPDFPLPRPSDSDDDEQDPYDSPRGIDVHHK